MKLSKPSDDDESSDDLDGERVQEIEEAVENNHERIQRVKEETPAALEVEATDDRIAELESVVESQNEQLRELRETFEELVEVLNESDSLSGQRQVVWESEAAPSVDT